MKHLIKQVQAREILDSRGDPTVEVEVELTSGEKEVASVPSGASTGKHEAHELRDGDAKRYGGRGVLKAVANVDSEINKSLQGMDVVEQQQIDRMLIELDGTKNKSRLGANAILGVSLACARLASQVTRQPLYQYIRKKFKLPYKNWLLPRCLMNLINGGRHADSNLIIQEIIIVPQVFKIDGKIKKVDMAESIRVGSEVFHALAKVLKRNKLDTDLGSEGGYAPNFDNCEQAYDFLIEAITEAGFKTGEEVAMALDVAASEFFSHGSYGFEGKEINTDDLLNKYQSWLKKYPFISIEDGLHQDDWSGWIKMTKILGNYCQLVGDDLFVTNLERIKIGSEMGAANAVIIKPNQIGTLTETIAAIEFAHQHNFKTVVSHRSGETMDTFIADLSAAVNSEFIKAGSLARGERVAKYNRLLAIEQELTV